MNILTYKGYQGSFEYDPEADIFHGDVLHLQDVITFQGRSIDELKQALADSVEDYFDLCKAAGKEPEKPYSGSLRVRLEPELHLRLAQRAAQDGLSLNKWVAQTLKQALGR